MLCSLNLRLVPHVAKSLQPSSLRDFSGSLTCASLLRFDSDLEPTEGAGDDRVTGGGDEVSEIIVKKRVDDDFISNTLHSNSMYLYLLDIKVRLLT